MRNKYGVWMNARLERIFVHLPETDDLSLLALKGHLLIEEVLNDLIKNRCKNPQAIQGIEMPFNTKAKLSRALWGSEHPNGFFLEEGFWNRVDALNALRNAFVHNLESPKIQQRLDRFFTLTYAHLAPNEKDETEAQKLSSCLFALHSEATSFEAAGREFTVEPALAP